MAQKRKIWKSTTSWEDEIKFKELFKNPIRLFGWVYPYFIGILLIFGIFYVKNLTQVSFNEQPGAVPDSTNMIKDIPMKKGGIMPAVDLSIIKNPLQDLIAHGKDLFQTNCTSCHGDKGMGDGPAGAALNPKPRNFHSTDGWVNGRKFNEMYKTLQEGVPNSGMAAYEYLPPKDRIALIQYIRTFADFPKITDDEVTDLDNTYNLSKTTIAPNTIPVDIAMEKISAEDEGLTEKVEQAVKKFANDKSEDAQLISKFSLDKKKVFVSFLKGNLGKSFDQFVKTVSSEPNQLGFSSQVVDLPQTELKKIFDFLVKETS